MAEAVRARRASRRVRPPSAWPVETRLAVGLLALYLAFLKGHLDSIDGLVMYRQGLSLALHGSVDLVPPVHFGRIVAHDTKFGIGQSLLYVPTTWVGHLFGLRQYEPSTSGTIRQFYADPMYTVACSWINAVVTAATAACVGKCLRALHASPAQIVVGVLGFGMGSVALTYSTTAFAQPLAALMCALAVLAVFRWQTHGSANRALLAFALGYCVLTRPAEGLILGVACCVYVGARRWSGWIWPIGGLAAAIAIDMLVNLGRFGSVTKTGYHEKWELGTTGVVGLLITPGRGLVWFMPVALLAPWGCVQLVRRGRSVEACLLGTLLLGFFASAAFWDIWWGGVAWGPRLLVPALPVVAIIAAYGVTSRRSLVFAAALIAAGFVLLLPTVLVDILAVHLSVGNFEIDALPAIGAWSSLHHLIPRRATYRSGIDVLWVRFVDRRGPVVLLVPLALLAFSATWIVRATTSALRRQ